MNTKTMLEMVALATCTFFAWVIFFILFPGMWVVGILTMLKSFDII